MCMSLFPCVWNTYCRQIDVETIRECYLPVVVTLLYVIWRFQLSIGKQTLRALCETGDGSGFRSVVL